MAIAAVGLLLIGACAKSSSTENPRALTEYDFAADPTLSLQPGQVGVTFLEAVDAGPTGLPDTRIPGLDIIPFEVTEAKSYSYALDDADGAISHAVIATGDAEAVLLDLTPASPTGSVVLKPGWYALLIVSGNTVEQNQGETSTTVFLHRVGPVSGLSSEASTLAGVVPKVNQADLGTLLSTRKCQACNLSDANLSGANLRNAELGPNEDNEVTTLSRSNLSRADLTRADMRGAYMTGANLENAKLTNANLGGAKLGGVNLTGADLTNANLGFSVLTGANLSGAILTGADFTFATWTDGRNCARGSIGACN